MKTINLNIYEERTWTIKAQSGDDLAIQSSDGLKKVFSAKWIKDIYENGNIMVKEDESFSFKRVKQNTFHQIAS